MTTYFAPLLHIYQPPTQEVHILREINKECYKPLFEVIDHHQNAKFSLNINGILIEMLNEYGMSDTIDLIKNLVAENKLEILGTAKFHPILPLIPKKEVRHQIQLNEEINREEFGHNWVRKGFFPPELAVSPNVIKYIREMGYEWVIMSGISCPADWCYDKIYQTSNGLKLFFRDDILSNKIAFKEITAKEVVLELGKKYKSKKVKKPNNTYIITAMDGETFGHHIKNYEKVMLGRILELLEDPSALITKNEELIKLDSIQTEFISNLHKFFPYSSEYIIPYESSWSTSDKDLECQIPYPLWKHPENNIHKYYWKIMKSLDKLMNLVDNLDLTENWDVERYYKTARYFYDRGLHSCSPWWSNPLRGAWSPNLVYNGVELLIRAALNAQLALVNAGKSDGDGYFDSISYYHGLLLMELYSTTKKNNNVK